MFFRSTPIKMKIKLKVFLLMFFLMGLSCKNVKNQYTKGNDNPNFPSMFVNFSPIADNPVFQGTNEDTWDKNIRERGYILYENGLYKMWYTGFNYSISNNMYLGYATSKDGINWNRYTEQSILPNLYVEDMQVIKYNNMYYMVAEGRGDIAHFLTSNDGISWAPQGNLTIHMTNGEPISEGPYGTPTVWIENDRIYLFYERNDSGIWLATSENFKLWTNVQDEPVLEMGPDKYDSSAVATNQIIKYQGKYYMYYHGSSNPDWMKPGSGALWNSNVAMSKDLINWTKYPNNPIVKEDHSSPIVVFDGKDYTLYTMHDKVFRYNANK
jgi:predicted GH43/DUF377 family glycosyl hydrolase